MGTGYCQRLAVSVGTQEPPPVPGGQGRGWAGRAGAHMAVMVSLWKVTKAMPRGFSFTFSFSRL